MDYRTRANLRALLSRLYYREPTVVALTFDPENRLFLMKSHKWGGRYMVPGGHVEPGETLKAALRRTARAIRTYLAQLPGTDSKECVQ